MQHKAMQDELVMKTRNSQQGIALLVMLFVLVLAATGYVIKSLDSVTIKNEREKKTAQALSDAKTALVGYMLKRVDSLERPGDLPCPDKATDGNYDGTQDATCASTRVGKFPWKTDLDGFGNYRDGIALDLTDDTYERFWYAVSRNLVDPTNVQINSDLLVSAPYPWLSIYDSKGSLVSNRAIAVIVAPMSLLAGQNRSVPLPPAAQYLDNVTLGGVLYNNATSAPAKFINGTVYDPLNPSALKVNDKVSYITIDEVMPRIELRVARELKQCLDEYALASNGKYPWPEPTDGGAFDITSSQRWFGRVSATPNIETGAGSDAQMQSAWTPSCTTLFTSAYWLEWRNLIFYQIADNFIPSGSKSCILGSCISISGTGNSSAGSGTYRAVVMVAGKTLPPQTRVATISASNYLEDDALSGINNNHQAVFSKSFVTYKPFSAAYNTVNDLIICLDGKNACK